MTKIVIIADDIRSAHNVGSLIRTAEGMGVDKVYLTGYTPYPLNSNDNRLPHLARKIHSRISKTALGTENTQPWEYAPDVHACIQQLKKQGYTIAGLEQAPNSRPLSTYQAPKRVAIVLGNEVTGIGKNVLAKCEDILEIPMLGKKESFNVTEAASMVLFHLRHHQ